MGDNSYMVPTGYVHQQQLDADIKNAIGKLGSDVIHVAYSIGTDSTGEPSIFFRIVLADEATNEETLAEKTSSITTSLFDEVRPIENWGLHPYFNFRSQSEQRQRNDPEWL